MTTVPTAPTVPLITETLPATVRAASPRMLPTTGINTPDANRTVRNKKLSDAAEIVVCMVNINPSSENKNNKSNPAVLRIIVPIGERSTEPGTADAKLAENEICKNGNSTAEQIRLIADKNSENDALDAAAADTLPPETSNDAETGKNAARYCENACKACPATENRLCNKA